MSSLVLLGEQSSALELAGLLERLNCGSGLAAVAAKPAALLEVVFKQQAAVLAANDEDLSAVLALSYAVLAQLTVAAEAATATQKLAALLTTEPATRGLFKIRALNNLINVVGGLSTVTPAQRFAVLLQLLEFALVASATSASLSALVLQPLAKLTSLVDFWKLTAEQALALYSASYKLACLGAGASRKVVDTVVYQLGAQPTLQHEYLFALLKAVDAAGAANPAVLREKANQDLAVAAAVASVGNGLSSTVHTLDASNLFPLAVIQSLSASNSAQASSAFALLRIVANADLTAWFAFEKSHGAFLAEHKLDAATLLAKLRTLALARAAVANQAAVATSDNILTYAAIREQLQLKAGEEVENVVIEAVMAGRIDAKMDQEAETLFIKRVVGGVPLELYSGANSSAAWSALGARLRNWKNNLHTVLTTLNLSQQIEQQEEDLQ